MSDEDKVAGDTQPQNDNPAQNAAPTLSGEDLGTVRDWLIKANPDVVPELVAGGSIQELQASVEPARAAYSRIAEAARQAPASAADSAPKVPAGTVPTVVDVESLPTSEKLRRGVEQRYRGRNRAS